MTYNLVVLEMNQITLFSYTPEQTHALKFYKPSISPKIKEAKQETMNVCDQIKHGYEDFVTTQDAKHRIHFSIKNFVVIQMGGPKAFEAKECKEEFNQFLVSKNCKFILFFSNFRYEFWRENKIRGGTLDN